LFSKALCVDDALIAEGFGKVATEREPMKFMLECEARRTA
jgi:hypothetical protein